MTTITLALAFLVLVVGPLVAEPQAQPTRPARIGFLWTASPSAASSYRDAFADGLRQLGYVDGRDVTIDHRYAEDRLEALPGLATEIVRLGVDVVVTQGTPAARSLGLRLQPLAVRGPKDLEAAFADARRHRAEALLVLPSPVLNYQHRRLVELAARDRMPASYQAREFVEAGGLMSYGPHLPDLVRRSATYVHKILNGAKPADLPVEQPVQFELVVNLKTAKALGLTIPPAILTRAGEVIR